MPHLVDTVSHAPSGGTQSSSAQDRFAAGEHLSSRVPERKHSTINLPPSDEELPSIPIQASRLLRARRRRPTDVA